MNKILEKIYLETDLGANISLFIGSLVAFFVYLKTSDTVLVTLSFIGCFSLLKGLTNFIKNTHKSTIFLNNFSSVEKETINVFISKGTCFVTMSDYKKGILDETGLDSLISRNIITFIDRSMGNGPTGFLLDENIYGSFLRK
ncbi:MAG: hypothetical protein ACI9AR_000295 [Flavobacteriaceae bacterium]|jgi:hypothetical protein